jgi:MoCo/4Fe-4S cofactor protein with predicted Tat translocation signal
MSNKQYWQGLDQVNPTPAVLEAEANEFQQSLPFEDTTGILEAKTPRRDFLKYLGFSTAAAIAAASCETPVRKAISWGVKPNDIVPGVPMYYASAFVDAGEVIPVLVKTRDARPIKIEGNKDSAITKGGTSARVQASVLSLYDNTRLRQPEVNNKKVDNWDEVNNAFASAMAAAGSKPVYLLTSTINSPSILAAIAQFTTKFPNTKHVMYDAISYSGLLDAAATSTGKRAIPSYKFDAADTIVSIGADFLGTWLSPVEFAKAYSTGRKVSAANVKMSKHYQLEGTMTITGGSADERATCRPSEYGKVAIALLSAINGTAPAFKSAHLNTTISKAAADLKKGNGLVVCGSNDKATQEVVFAINAAIGAFGKSINTAVSNLSKQGSDAAFNAAIADIKSGAAGGVMVMDANPVYEHPDGEAIAKAIKNLPLSVSFNDRKDETTENCKILAPTPHWLECWGDFEYKTGYTAYQQPTINPLFKNRTMAESLLHFSGNKVSFTDFFLARYNATSGNEAFDKMIQLGIAEPAAEPIGGSYSGNAAAAIAAINAAPAITGKELVVYEKVGIGRGGIWSNNPWLQELPDPVSKCTWDNYVAMSPATAKANGAEQTDINEVVRGKKVFKVKVGNTELDLPVAVIPGMHDDVVAVAVGYGRNAGAGMAAHTTEKQGGKNAYKLLTVANGALSFANAATITPTKKTIDLAITQTHHSYEGRHQVVKEITFAEYAKDPMAMYKHRQAELEHFLHGPEGHGGEHGSEHGGAHAQSGHADAAHTSAEGQHVEVKGNGRVTVDGYESDLDKLYRKNGTLYPVHEPLGLKWGMSIDLNSCTGCGACTIACQAENNVSVVGKEQVLLAHEMHWLRIDRYYTSTNNNPFDSDSIQTVFMPVMCQHCDNAPCENVCPVNASNHSNEGINQMAYNRCIGTRYCANNCPYKVRRFNWRDWNGADSFAGNSHYDNFKDDINSDLTRMVLNPDVTVRSRGVIEKCSFCVQRLQAGKSKAKAENRMVNDADVQVACAQACPTNAIVFGNTKDTESEIHKVRMETSKERLYYMLEDLHVLPNVNYMYKVRNAEHAGAPHEEVHAAAGHNDAHKDANDHKAEAHSTETKKEQH